MVVLRTGKHIVHSGYMSPVPAVHRMVLL
jgi:hypothetical protein